MFRGLVGGKTLSETDLEPVLEKLKDHLIGKNVAAEIAGKLCQSVGKKLEGKVCAFVTSFIYSRMKNFLLNDKEVAKCENKLLSSVPSGCEIFYMIIILESNPFLSS